MGHGRVRSTGAVVAALVIAGAASAGARADAGATERREPTVTASWETSGGLLRTVRENTVLRAVVELADVPRDGVLLTFRVDGGVVTRIPDGCRPSTIKTGRTALTPGAGTLSCQVDPVGGGVARVLVDVLVDDAQPLSGATVTAKVGVRRAGTVALPSRRIISGPARETRQLRLLSSPDFLNADVGDLGKGPTGWQRGDTANSTSATYRTALDTVLHEWSSMDPDALLVAGDLVEGHWAEDPQKARVFGPVRTTAEKLRAIDLAAATYYPQWLSRIRQAGLDVYPAIGDHEYGDNPWPRWKWPLIDTMRDEFSRRILGSTPGSPRFADRPVGSPAEYTAYAFRPRPDVQVITLDVFDHTADGMHLRIDPVQLAWVIDVLKRARADGVTWTIAQGHVPIVGPNRTAQSSGLELERGAKSPLWQAFARYGLDVYLAGEAHAVTTTARDGIVQITHGGAFHHALTNFLVADVYPDRIDFDLRDFGSWWTDAPDKSRLFTTRRSGMPKNLVITPGSYTIGTGTLHADGTFDRRSGIMLPWDGRSATEQPVKEK